jgi:hypothetical protein
MLSNNTRNKIKSHFGNLKKDVSQQIIKYDEDFTQEAEADETNEYLESTTSEKYDNYDKNEHYRYIGDEYLDLNDISVKGRISIIIYGVNTQILKPFLLFLFEKKNNSVMLPSLDISELTKISALHSTLKESFKKYVKNMDYQGFFNNDGEVFLFYKMNINLTDGPKLASFTETYFYVSIHEIINVKTVYQTNVDEHTSNFFIKNEKFCYLEDEDFNLIETPMTGYTGSYYKKIAIIAGLGPIRGTPFSSMGPYFYFSTFKRAMRYGVLTYDGKPKEVSGVKITLDDTPIYEKGGIVKFVLFLGNEKVFLNRDNDPDDESDISKSIAEKSAIVKSTIKNRDNDSKWVNNYDSTIITFKQIEFKGKTRDLEPQYTIKDTHQLMPISYYYLDTNEVLNNFEQDGDYKHYDYMKARII